MHEQNMSVASSENQKRESRRAESPPSPQTERGQQQDAQTRFWVRVCERFGAAMCLGASSENVPAPDEIDNDEDDSSSRRDECGRGGVRVIRRHPRGSLFPRTSRSQGRVRRAPATRLRLPFAPTSRTLGSSFPPKRPSRRQREATLPRDPLPARWEGGAASGRGQGACAQVAAPLGSERREDVRGGA